MADRSRRLEETRPYDVEFALAFLEHAPGCEWRGFVTIDALQKLRAYGRL
jgi:hypothetical protein